MDSALVIGGTGTLGHAIVPLLLRKGIKVTVLSREELKQKKMKLLYPEVKFVLGDVRDYDSIYEHCLGKTIVFHLAAMKHVEIAEENVSESIKINLLGTHNVARACRTASVSHAVFSSTDKAVLPINVYGMCKAASERLWLDYNRNGEGGFSVFRWGNVLGSRGSVIHAFVSSLQNKGHVNITHPQMTRFWIHIDDAARFMVDNYKDPGVHIPPIKAAKVTDLAQACATYLNVFHYAINYIGVRPGEKLHECLDYDELQNFNWTSNTVEPFTKEELYNLVERTLCQKP